MKNPTQMILFAAAFSCLAACVPMAGAYYAPTASEGSVGGGGREPSVIHLVRGDDIHVDVGTSGDDAAGSGRAVVVVTVPRSDSLHFKPGDVRVTAPDSSVLATLTEIDALPLSASPSDRRLDRLDLTISELPGDRFPSASKTLYRLYYSFEVARPDVFHVRLPAMQADGKDYPAVDILFTKTHGAWVQPVM